ncbi:MAG: hypothetical protein M0Q23_00625 [Syntrophales bacterium]|jgi:hypothetical protein|nr:hypothetical protein [Syntrophales bacterium]MCK9527152.1 hypothetical protein [Syntrophales bacterium]MDX9921723.1 hypothetical protein [Syntrophales bacterium]
MRRKSFDNFDATELYCSRCRRSVPVRKNLLLVLPQGDKYDYRCVFCGMSVGERQDSDGGGLNIIFDG